MTRKTTIAIAAAALVGLGAAGLAVTSMADEGWGGYPRYGHHMGGGPGFGRHGGPRHDGPRGMHMFEQFDADRDGRLTQAEIDQVRQERLARFDADGDGALNLEEYEALWVDAMRDRMVDRFQMHDDDGDGLVTQEEFGARFARMVQRMDRNGDGVIDASDMGPRHRSDDDD